MAENQAMTTDEKQCLSTATGFLNEAMKLIQFDGQHVMGATVHEAGGSMLGEIAGEKYRDCMRRKGQTQRR